MTEPISATLFLTVCGAMSVAVMGLAAYVVALHKDLGKEKDGRRKDLQEHANQAQLALLNSQKSLTKFTDSVDHLQDAMCVLIDEVRDLPRKRR